MGFEFSGSGFLEEPSGERYPVEYAVRSHVDEPVRRLDSVGRVWPKDPELLLELFVKSRNRQFALVLSDGRRLPVRLYSLRGSFQAEGGPQAPAVESDVPVA